MRRTYSFGKRILAMLLCVAMIMIYLPKAAVYTEAAGADARYTDASTMNDWDDYFLHSHMQGVDLTTENAGAVWTDKSVFPANAIPAELKNAVSLENTHLSVEDTGDNFLVALSAMASNKEIVGYSTIPTDTVFVLDLSSSMRSNDASGGSAIDELVAATNKAITDVLELNKNNRVSVVLYAGNTSGQFNENPGATTVILPLDTYTAPADRNGVRAFLESAQGPDEYNRQRDDYAVKVAANVKNSGGQTVAESKMNTARGTFMQDGIYEAMRVFRDEEHTKVQSGVQAGTTRLPIMVLMTDGEPTMASSDYNGNAAGTDLGNSDVYLRFNDQDYNHRDTIAFLSQLTAAYAKREISQHYENDALIYTLAFGEEVNRLEEALSVMDPARTSDTLNGFWNTFLAGNDVTVFTTQISGGWNRPATYEYLTVENDTAEPLNAADKLYVEKFFPAETIAELNQAFQSIVDEIVIQSKYYPTYVEKDHDHDGYITFTDKIGGYMDIKSLKGFVVGDHYFSGATLSKGFVADNSIFGSITNPNALGDQLVASVKARLGIESTQVAQALLQDAFDKGQLSYVDDTHFSNYIGWYSDADGNYLDFWFEGADVSKAPAEATHIVKSYGFLGETNRVHGISDTDMLYASVRVSKELKDYDGDGITGETMLLWRLPASLIPTLTYEVEVTVDSQGTITGVQSVELENANVKPIRLLYEIGLQDGIHDWNVAEKVGAGYVNSTTNKDAGYVFYTNQWKKGGTASDAASTNRNTYSHFEPSVQNERYYYTENTPICTDQNGTEYTSAAKPDASGTYYRAFQVFEKLADGSYRMHTHYEQISAEALGDAIQVDGQWYIPKGEVHRYLDSFSLNKPNNETNTLRYSHYPSVVAQGSAYYAYSTLGNNGKLLYTPATGVRVTKSLADGYTNDSTFTFEISGDLTGAQLVKLDATGDEASREALAANGQFELKAEQSVYIIGLKPGSYTVSELTEDQDYAVSSVKVNHVQVSGTQADVTLAAQQIIPVEFTNDAKGYGNLYITKEIVSDHDIPAAILTESFEVSVFVGTGLAGEDYAIEYTDASGAVQQAQGTVAADGYLKVNGANLHLPADHAYEVIGLPEGTQVVVTEHLTGAQNYFTGTIKTRDHTGAEQDNDGAVTISRDGNATAVITNTYKPAPVSVSLDISGKKLFDIEATLTQNVQFQFALQEWENNDWQTVKTASVDYTAADGYGDDIEKTFAISALQNESFDKVGAYAYQVVELSENPVPNVVYDPMRYTFTVIITDAGGVLEAEIIDHGGNTLTGNYAVEFNNTHHVAPVVVDIQKYFDDTTDNPAITAAGFTVIATVTDSQWVPTNETHTEVTDGAGQIRFAGNYDRAGEYYYIVREQVDATRVAAGWEYDPTVYYLKVVVTQQASGDLIAQQFVGTSPDSLVATADVELAFTNTYDPEDAQVDLDVVPTVLKHLENKTLTAGAFTFYVTEDGNHSNVYLTGTNDADGKVIFADTLSFEAIGEYKFDIIEKQENTPGVTYDKTVYDLVVEVSDNGDGTLKAIYYFEDSVTGQVTFHNVYNIENGQLVIDGTKNLTGRPMLNAEFRFALTQVTDESGTTAVQNGLTLQAANRPDNDHNGKAEFAFPAITYTKADVGNTYYYRVQEENGGEKILGVKYDDTQYVVKVEVSDNGDGTLKIVQSLVSGNALVFNNVYTPASVNLQLQGLKNLEGKDLADYTFQFHLYAADSAYNKGSLLETVTSDASGAISFASRTYSSTGKNYYIIEEESGSEPGIRYDTAKYYVCVTVTDAHTGKLAASAAITKVITTDNGGTQETTQLPVSSVVFNNQYQVTGDTTVTLNGTKTIDGRSMTANDSFTFELYKTDSSFAVTGQPEETATTRGDQFSIQLDYSADELGQTYYYVVREKNAGQTINGITYSTQEYRLSVEVKDNGVGGIVAQIAGSGLTVNGETAQGLDFTNTYAAAPVDYFPEAQKVYEGDTMKTFDFVLSGNGFATQTKQNDAQGKVVFDKLTFVEAGTYTFIVKEKENVLWGFIKWDTNKYELVIEVTDNGLGQLEVSNVTVTSTKGRDDLVFRNVHEDLITKKDVALESKPGISIDGQKVQVGDVLVYTITYTNYTGVAVDEVTITDTIPQHTEFVVGSAGAGVLVGNQLSWKFTNVAADAVINVSFKVKVAEGGVTVTNEAVVLEGTNTYESNEVTNQVEKKDPKLTIVKQQAVGSGKATAEKLDAEIGSTVTYFLTVTNSGEGEAKEIVVSDKIPEGLVYVAGSADNSGTLESGVLTWKIPSLAPGQSIQLQFKVKIPTVTKDTSWTNVATMVSEYDPEAVESNEVVVTAKIPVTPDTGDNFSATLFIALMVLSSFGIAAILVCKKREEEKTAQ